MQIKVLTLGLMIDQLVPQGYDVLTELVVRVELEILLVSIEASIDSRVHVYSLRIG